MDQLDQDLKRFKLPAMAAVGGIAAALVVATLPAVYLEKIIGLTGISEIISAAAPPLGNTAKGLIAAVAGLVSASVIYVFLNRKGGSDMSLAIRKNLTPDPIEEEAPKAAKFALPKFSLKKLLKKPSKKAAAGAGDGRVMDLADLPKLREADSHPDAPARRPIFAEQDLGSPLASAIKPFEDQPEAEEAAAPDAEKSAPEIVAAPFTADKSLRAEEVAAPEVDLSQMVTPPPATQAPVAETPVAQAPAAEAPVQQAEAPAMPAPTVATPAQPKEDLSGLSIAELADRLENGLARLQQLETATRSLEQSTAPAPSAAQPAHAPSDKAAGGITVASEEAPMAVPPLKPVEKTEEEVQAARQADMDAALKAALGTLEKMTAQR